MKLSICVIYEDGTNLKKWRDSLPSSDIYNIEIVALKTSVNSSINAPREEIVGKADSLIGLSLEYPSYFDYFDFSECRNILDKHATGDWILHVDSDEFLANQHDDFWSYIEALNKSDADAAWVSIAGVSYEGNGDKAFAKRYNIPNLRLHRKSANISWAGICHETLDTKGREVIICDTEILFQHTGYAIEREDMIKKCERNAKLMIREYARENSERNWKYLLNTFSLIKKLQEE